MRSLSPDRLMLSGNSATTDAGVVLSSLDFRRVSARRDDSLSGGLFRVGGGLADAVASIAIPATVMLSDGTQIIFNTVAA
jgi:hypothetical protein